MFDEIYNTMIGILEKEYELPWVDNAFEEGQHCMRAYEEMRDAYERICERLDVGEEDDDLNIIVDCFESMQRELCRRMFDCGVQYIMEKHYLDKIKM